jgi:hypothetical protein
MDLSRTFRNTVCKNRRRVRRIAAKHSDFFFKKISSAASYDLTLAPSAPVPTSLYIDHCTSAPHTANHSPQPHDSIM